MVIAAVIDVHHCEWDIITEYDWPYKPLKEKGQVRTVLLTKVGALLQILILIPLIKFAPITIWGTDFIVGGTGVEGSICADVPIVYNSTTLACNMTYHDSLYSVVPAITTTNGTSISPCPSITYASKPQPIISNISLGYPCVNTGVALIGCPVNTSSLTLNGINLFLHAIVTITPNNSAPVLCQSVVVTVPTKITCTIPVVIPALFYSISVHSYGGNSIPAINFTYAARPVITSIVGGWCLTASALSLHSCNISINALTINGDNFYPFAVPIFTPSLSAAFTISTQTLNQIVLVLPTATAASTFTISVNSTGGASTNTATLTYAAAPTITALAMANCGGNGTLVLNTCPISSGTLYINGTNFFGSVTVTINGFSCTSITLYSTTSLSCTAPPANPTTSSVVVLNSAGGVAGGGSVRIDTAAQPNVANIYMQHCSNSGAVQESEVVE